MSETAVNGVEPIIFLDDVHVTFSTRTGSILHPNLVHAVQGVTIKLMPGQTIGIVGESGCGKSTTANVMCGLQAPTSGKVYFKGKDVTKRTAEDRRHMGRVISVVFQNPATALNPRMVVREQLLDPMRVHNLGTEAEQEEQRAEQFGPQRQFPVEGGGQAVEGKGESRLDIAEPVLAVPLFPTGLEELPGQEQSQGQVGAPAAAAVEQGEGAAPGAQVGCLHDRCLVEGGGWVRPAVRRDDASARRAWR